jgi:hypothetical protein
VTYVFVAGAVAWILRRLARAPLDTPPDGPAEIPPGAQPAY